MVALIENRAREVGLALYRLRSFDVELRQYCDSNSFSTTLAALVVSAYVSLRRWHGTLWVRKCICLFSMLCRGVAVIHSGSSMPWFPGVVPRSRTGRRCVELTADAFCCDRGRVVDEGVPPSGLHFISAHCSNRPTEIVLSVTSEKGPLNAALQRSSMLSGVRRSFVQRGFFSDTTGALYVDRLSVDKSADLALSSDVPRYLALAACGALLRYIEYCMDTTFVPRTLRIQLRPNAGILFMDLPSMSSLELVSTLSDSPTKAARKQTLLGLLDHTKTRAGHHFLRRNLLEPPCDQPTFEMRQAVVAEVSASEDMYFPAAAALENFPDLEALVSRLAQRANRGPASTLSRAASEASSSASAGVRASSISSAGTDDVKLSQFQSPDMNLVRNVLLLKQGLSAIPNLVHALSGARSPLLLTVCETLRSPLLATLWDHIHDVIDEEALCSGGTAEQQRLSGAFAVKPGVNGVLDLARKSLTETLDDIRALVRKEKEEQRLDKLVMSFSVKRGYHMSLPVDGGARTTIRNLPSSFVEPVQQGKKIHVSTYPLMDLNNRYESTLDEIWRLSNRELGRVVSYACSPTTMGALHRMCDAVAMTDALLGFVTHVSLREGYVRPVFTGIDGPIDVKQGRHPVLDCITGEECVPNDVFFSSPGTNALIITGVNGAGKSVYLKLVALLCIMAQAGCPIPASSARLRTIHRICTRVGTSDSLERSESSFSLEMAEVAAILSGLPLSSDDRRVENGSRGSSSRRQADGDAWEGVRQPVVHGANSLIIIDELGRSTSAVDGFAVTWAIMERLCRTPRTFTLLATHFTSLCALRRYEPTIAMFHLACASRGAAAEPAVSNNAVDEPASRGRPLVGAALLLGDGANAGLADSAQRLNREGVAGGSRSALPDGVPRAPDLRPTFRLTAGPCTTPGYGLSTAAAAGVPASFIRDALAIRSQLPARVLEEMVNGAGGPATDAAQSLNPFAVSGR